MLNQDRIKKSLGLRLVIIALLSLILLIPGGMIQSLITERQDRHTDAVEEVTSKWGKSQTVLGPVLSVPFGKDGQTNYAYFLPDELAIKALINPEIRYRGIYEVALYNAQLQVTGRFSFPDYEELNIRTDDIQWEGACVFIGISDIKGIKDLTDMTWNQQKYKVSPGIDTKVFLSGISVKTNLSSKNTNEKYDFSLSMSLKGSSNLMFTPVGEMTKVDISSSWQNPSFIGNFLPETHRIFSDGFNAQWQILNLNRNLPRHWIGNRQGVASSSFGVNLFLPVDEYQKTMRTAKYAIMFISLTFLSFFLIELLNKKAIHPIQYILIGFALLIFYTLLLSLSEHMVFNQAYLIASLSIVLLIMAYTKSVLKTNFHAMTIGGILTLLYAFLFVVLQLQDFALLIGSFALFMILATVMYITRNVDWFAIMKPEGTAEKT